ncbi:MAG: hypothetical protein GTN89_13450 [Acidobacteria bacterium]|nr:hypothetical protein [Acidobacteriota bacterium]NIM60253.1 hypothetical protein [Acidobacteriota bacterium]NIO60291.1 hypothetical protein [Acidobacteriota bacterium]NIQ31346.1 hypothetical protein [Acidobacteriota bacterium]NIQ86569.1 hypothetical protein [Acidobacteriota bacterium]
MTSERNSRRWRNRALVRERDTRRARRLWVGLALSIAALAPAGVYLYQQSSCVQLSYELESIKDQREQLAEIERRLAVRHADAAAMRNIERWAARKRFERPESTEVFVLRPGGAAGDTVAARVPGGTAEHASARSRRSE